MKQIELSTTQNVILKYELPDVMVRIAAFFIDAAILCLSLLILTFLGQSVFGQSGDISYIYMYVIIIPIGMFYTLVSEIMMKGQTIGKKALGIRRIHMTGKPPEFSDYVLVWTMRLIEIYSSLGTLAIIFILGSENNQRLGDKLSNTIVIKTLKGNKGILNEILKMNKNEKPKIIYPQVVNFEENQVLFMKNCLLRVQKYPNPNNKSVMNDLCEKIANELSIDKIPTNKNQFITQLIKDYVVLTR